MSAQSDTLRQELSTVMDAWRDLFAACIKEGQAKGEIKSSRPAHDLAEFFISGWNGAMMRAKSARNTKPLDIFVEIVFTEVLKTSKEH